jgi:hypothetical protein
MPGSVYTVPSKPVFLLCVIVECDCGIFSISIHLHFFHFSKFSQFYCNSFYFRTTLYIFLSGFTCCLPRAKVLLQILVCMMSKVSKRSYNASDYFSFLLQSDQILSFLLVVCSHVYIFFYVFISIFSLLRALEQSTSSRLRKKTIIGVYRSNV